MKKKLSAVMTACMLMFALAACGNTGNNAEGYNGSTGSRNRK